MYSSIKCFTKLKGLIRLFYYNLKMHGREQLYNNRIELFLDKF